MQFTGDVSLDVFHTTEIPNMDSVWIRYSGYQGENSFWPLIEYLHLNYPEIFDQFRTFVSG